MLGRRPSPHVVAALGHQPEDGIGAEAMDLRQIRAQERVQGRPGVEVGFVSALGVPHRRQGRLRCRSLSVQRPQDGLDLHVTFRNLVLVHVVQFQRMAQGEQMFRAVFP